MWAKEEKRTFGQEKEGNSEKGDRSISATSPKKHLASVLGEGKRKDSSIRWKKGEMTLHH